MSRIYRHGDILLVPTKIPDGAKQIKIENEYILAFGEKTGHAHRLKSAQTGAPTFLVFEYDGERYIKVEGKTELSHEEHILYTGEGLTLTAEQWSERLGVGTASVAINANSLGLTQTTIGVDEGDYKVGHEKEFNYAEKSPQRRYD